MLAKTKKYIEDTKKLKEDYKKDITSIKETIKIEKAENFFVEENKIESIDELKNNLRKRKKEYRIQKKLIQKPISFYVLFFICIILIFGIIGVEIYLAKYRMNYENDYFAFRYNEDKIFIDDYTEIANMWLISTGGGLYAPSSILIGYNKDAKEIDVEYALYAMQEKLGGEKLEEEVEIKASFAYDNYILTLDNNLTYRILSKGIKKNNKILTVMFVNAGDLSEEEQAYLYQVYDTIKLK